MIRHKAFYKSNYLLYVITRNINANCLYCKVVLAKYICTYMHTFMHMLLSFSNFLKPQKPPYNFFQPSNAKYSYAIDLARKFDHTDFKSIYRYPRKGAINPKKLYQIHLRHCVQNTVTSN